MERIFECISNLQFLSVNIQAVKSEWKKLGIESGNPVDADLQWYSVIRLCIVNDEIENLYSLAKDDHELQLTLSMAKPALKEIRRYKDGLRLFRNKALAHFNRDSAGNFQPMEEWILKATNVPRSKGEHEFLYNCVDLAVAVLASRYGTPYQEFQGHRLHHMRMAIDEFGKRAVMRQEVLSTTSPIR